MFPQDAPRLGAASRDRLKTGVAARALALGLVAALHLVFVLFLGRGGLPVPQTRFVQPARLIPETRPPRPRPPPIPTPLAAMPPAAFLPLPDVQIASQPPALPAAITPPLRSAGRLQSHFGAATDAGLGLDVGTSSGGGAGARGSLAGFEAAVRRAVLAGKRQPTLAWDRRDTCVVNYAVRVDSSGGLAGMRIDPCAVPEINAAARAAIEAAALPRPPDLGAASYEVHGSLIFRP